MQEITSLFEHDHPNIDVDPCVAKASLRPPKHEIRGTAALVPNARYRLGDQIRLRNERFGCIVQSQAGYTIRYFDNEVARVLRECVNPIDGFKISSELSNDQLLSQLLPEQVLVPVQQSSPQRPHPGFIEVPSCEVSAELSAPVGLDVELTMRCGRHCTYCAYRSGPNASTSNELPADYWKYLLDQAATAGVMSIEFTGGDPLTRSDGMELVEYADALGFFITLNSDLTTLSAAAVQRLSNVPNIIAVQTTLDSSTFDVHDRQRGKGGYDQVIAGVERFREAGLPVALATVVTKANYQDIAEIAKICDRFDAMYSIASLYAAGRGADVLGQIPTDNELGNASRLYAESVFRGAVRPTHPSFYRHRDAFDQHSDTFNHLAGNPFMADVSLYRIRIGRDGKCYTSIRLEGTPYFIVGDATQSSLVDIWQRSSMLGFLRKKVREQPLNNFHALDLRSLSFGDAPPTVVTLESRADAA